jgi:hypothetical protein
MSGIWHQSIRPNDKSDQSAGTLVEDEILIFPGKPNFRDSEHLISRGWTDFFKLRADLIIWKKENGIRLERSDTLENEFRAASNAAFR